MTDQERVLQIYPNVKIRLFGTYAHVKSGDCPLTDILYVSPELDCDRLWHEAWENVQCRLLERLSE
jgi:hypothetical protein